MDSSGAPHSQDGLSFISLLKRLWFKSGLPHRIRAIRMDAQRVTSILVAKGLVVRGYSLAFISSLVLHVLVTISKSFHSLMAAGRKEHWCWVVFAFKDGIVKQPSSS